MTNSGHPIKDNTAGLDGDLGAVRRPSRYIGGEWNIVVKRDAVFHVALAFPDAYEIGMSHLGLKILYGLLNDQPGVQVERVFAPWPDREAQLRHGGRPLTSLETQRPLSAFDVVGFSLQYELAYTNLLTMLDLGGIAIDATRRRDGDPIVLAGGPCVVNPAPLAGWIDAFLIGEGEEAVPEMLSVLRDNRGARRSARLRDLAHIPGVYVPQVHGPRPDRPVRRRVVADLESAYYPTAPVVAHRAVHDRIAIEISRGCPRGCRFCQAGMIYRPLRERSPARILELAEASLGATGYDTLSFSSLSTGDYGCLLPLLAEANRRFAGRHVALSLPSVRVGSVGRDTLRQISGERKTGYTVAPEAGTDRLRRVINKAITETDFESGLTALFAEGWQTLKLYFMIGLPTETDEDLDGILRMARNAARMAREARVRRPAINVSVSTFVPKPHTPFQWGGQIGVEEIRRRQARLRDGLRGRALHFKAHDPSMSVIEAVLSRGAPATAALILAAWKNGARFDGWSEAFRKDNWQAAFDATGLDPDTLAGRVFGAGEPLPWDCVDPGVTTRFLEKEYERAVAARFSPECREHCLGCGLGCRDLSLAPSEAPAAPEPAQGHGIVLSAPTRFRVQYGKTGPLRYLSHLELKETFLRALRRAGLRTAFSKGFHPHPRVAFGPALGVAVAGEAEYLDMDLLSPVDVKTARDRLNDVLPEGFRVHEIRPAPGRPTAIDRFVCRYDYRVLLPGDIPPPRPGDEQDLVVERTDSRGRRRRLALGPFIVSTAVDGPVLRLTVQDRGDQRVRVSEVLGTLLGLADDDLHRLEVVRTGVYGFRNGWLTPMDVLAPAVAARA